MEIVSNVKTVYLRGRTIVIKVQLNGHTAGPVAVYQRSTDGRAIGMYTGAYIPIFTTHDASVLDSVREEPDALLLRVEPTSLLSSRSQRSCCFVLAVQIGDVTLLTNDFLVVKSSKDHVALKRQRAMVQTPMSPERAASLASFAVVGDAIDACRALSECAPADLPAAIDALNLAVEPVLHQCGQLAEAYCDAVYQVHVAHRLPPSPPTVAIVVKAVVRFCEPRGCIALEFLAREHSENVDAMLTLGVVPLLHTLAASGGDVAAAASTALLALASYTASA